MATKSFTSGLNKGLDSLINGNDQEALKPARQKPGPKKTNHKVITSTTQEGTKEGESRATFIVNEANLQKLKDVAYWDRINIKDVVNQAIDEFIEKYENEKGQIKPSPAKQKK